MKFIILVMIVYILGVVSAHASDVIAITALQRGTLLTDENIRFEPDGQTRTHQIRQQYIGKQLKRAVYAGHTIALSYVTEPTLVKRNARVNIVYTNGSLQLQSLGRALEAGAKGDLITVLNMSSRTKIIAAVTGIDSVEVSP